MTSGLEDDCPHFFPFFPDSEKVHLLPVFGGKGSSRGLAFKCFLSFKSQNTLCVLGSVVIEI
jgi:hypothetical protein